MRLPTKPTNRRFEDQTALPKSERKFREWLANQPSSRGGLSDIEAESRDNGWSLQDIYFNRAAESDYDLMPNKDAEYSGGQLYEKLKPVILQRYLEQLRRRPLQR